MFPLKMYFSPRNLKTCLRACSQTYHSLLISFYEFFRHRPLPSSLAIYYMGNVATLEDAFQQNTERLLV